MNVDEDQKEKESKREGSKTFIAPTPKAHAVALPFGSSRVRTQHVFLIFSERRWISNNRTWDPNA